MWGVYVGLCLPRMSWATALANRPSGTPAASTTCHSWLMSSGVAVKVFICCVASARNQGSKPKQTHKIASWEVAGQGAEGGPGEGLSLRLLHERREQRPHGGIALGQ